MNADFEEINKAIKEAMGGVVTWNRECNNKIYKYARKLQGEMLDEVTDNSPFREHSDEKDLKHLKTGWVKDTSKKKNNSTVWAVRNRNKSQLVHLLNFDHRYFAWGRDTGRTLTGTKFVTKAQDKAQEKLTEKIKEIYGE